MKVSVYCMVFNHEPYLRDALEGFVRQQTDFEYEVIVHDDASTDRSREIIEEYAKNYPAIIKPVFQQENQYSKGVRVVDAFVLPRLTGEYVAVCEGDDYWTDPMKLQLQVDFLDKHPDYVACVHNTMKLDMMTGVESRMFSHTQDEDITVAEALAVGGGCYHTSSLMYRREYIYNRPAFFQKAKGFADYPMAIYLTLSGKMRFINRTMSYYRFGSISSWTRKTRADTNKIAMHHQYVVDMLEEVDRYTDGAHHAQIEHVILQNRYKILFYKEQYSQLRKMPYAQLYRQMPASYRAKTYLKQFLKVPYRFYRKLVYGTKD